MPRFRPPDALARSLIGKFSGGFCRRPHNIILKLHDYLGPTSHHAPPLWSKHARAMFAPGQVAWYRLTPKDSAVAAAKF
jgi:hypothetical protein